MEVILILLGILFILTALCKPLGYILGAIFILSGLSLCECDGFYPQPGCSEAVGYAGLDGCAYPARYEYQAGFEQPAGYEAPGPYHATPASGQHDASVHQIRYALPPAEGHAKDRAPEWWWEG